jgi:hypothetical protein
MKAESTVSTNASTIYLLFQKIFVGLHPYSWCLFRTMRTPRICAVRGGKFPADDGGGGGVAVSIRLVVSGSSKESRIALVGPTGKELLASPTFTEPRAKGATLRALKKILGADVTIHDSTTTNRRPTKPAPPVEAIAARTTGVGAKSAAKKTAAAVGPRRPATAPVVKTPAARKTTKSTAKSGQSV